MPYKSDAQRRKFHAMADRGEISRETVKHWDEASRGKDLPERKKKEAAVNKEAYLLGYALGFDKEAAGRGGIGGVWGSLSRLIASGRGMKGGPSAYKKPVAANLPRAKPTARPAAFKSVKGVNMTEAEWNRYNSLQPMAQRMYLDRLRSAQTG